MSALEMKPGQTLSMGQKIVGDGGSLHMQTDGNLVLYTSKGAPIWSTNTSLDTVNTNPRVTMQADGNWVLVMDTPGVPGTAAIWSSNTPANAGAKMVVNWSLDEGYLRVVAPSGETLWQGYDANQIKIMEGLQEAILYPGATMNGGETLRVKHGSLSLNKQDGSLAVYDATGALKWSSPALVGDFYKGIPSFACSMQADGDLVINSPNAADLGIEIQTFSTGTAGHPGAAFRVNWDNDQPMVVAESGALLWNPKVESLRAEKIAAEQKIQAGYNQEIDPLAKARDAQVEYIQAETTLKIQKVKSTANAQIGALQDKANAAIAASDKAYEAKIAQLLEALAEG